jgi:cytochrome c biogenesis protein
MNQVYRFFRSVRLAVVLLLVITVLSILATLVPQGRDPAFYRSTYPYGVAALVLAMGFDRFFSSMLFLAPLALFMGNLGVCTVHRILTRNRGGAAPRYGPDLIHIGLLILAVGGITSTAVRREKYFTVGAGDAVDISGGYRLELLSFEFRRYENGSPKDWISTVRVTQGDKTVRESFAIEVNRPLRLGLLAVYQTSYDTDALLHLSDASGATYTLSPGDGIPTGGTVRFLSGAERSAGGEYVAVFEEWNDKERLSVDKIAAGGSVGAYRIDRITARELTGLTAVRDPGFIPVLAALILGGVGLGLTFIQRRKET